ncbi:MAG: acyl carrier protein [Leptolyngbyaceae cyanobacterium SM1_1_3]|nr:acyl carrier protein [Leptolyngbyaceae cyanobacterium SM1_1_3]NJN01318.1 acyl carrier protein [Leptolyngbyaceae cyanobacterium RM1_1_2]NJO09922.1 acyl carrier protein [Leptolyngbyaceae cyanobacterium SL_1_1]NJO52620.1 acyl carrier protein [Leptolyngbyaceae cyanobacterium RM2_2_4]
MNRDQVHKQLTEVFQDVFDDDEIEIENSTSARDISGWDSMNHINLVLGAEQEFGVKFKTAEVAQLANVGEFVDLILAKLEK